MTTRILNAIFTQPWAITQDALNTIVAVARRDLSDIDAAAAARALGGSRSATVRGDTAVIPVVGPLMRRANMFSDISGATSTEMLARDLQTALADPKVARIVLDIDSPGGEVNGINELAEAVYAGRSVKPITAFVGGLGASAAYWIASQATEVVCDATAMLGSIGVIAAWDTLREPTELEFTSQDSPHKRPDPSTTQGREQIQRLIDATYAVFVGAVARGRGVTADNVRGDFGRGGMFVGQQAVDAGLADRLGTLEALVGGARTPTPAPDTSSLLGSLSVAAPIAASILQQGVSMSDETQAPTVAPPVLAPPVMPPIPVAADAAVQAELNAYAAQMQAQIQAQMQAQFETMTRQAAEQAQLQFEKWQAEQRTQQQIQAAAQHLTTPTVARPHALPGTAEEYTRFLGSINNDARTQAVTLFTRILDSGLVAFDEIGSGGEGADAQTAKERFDAAVLVKMQGGMSKRAAIAAIQTEQPALYTEYRNGGR